MLPSPSSMLFLFNAPPPTHIYTLSLHDALPISAAPRLDGHLPVGLPQLLRPRRRGPVRPGAARAAAQAAGDHGAQRSEEHTSELQSLTNLVCRLLLEKKKNDNR